MKMTFIDPKLKGQDHASELLSRNTLCHGDRIRPPFSSRIKLCIPPHLDPTHFQLIFNFPPTSLDQFLGTQIPTLTSDLILTMCHPHSVRPYRIGKASSALVKIVPPFAWTACSKAQRGVFDVSLYRSLYIVVSGSKSPCRKTRTRGKPEWVPMPYHWGALAFMFS